MTSAQSIPAPPSGGGVTHVRHRHESHFTVVGNHLAQHPTLSATAIGIAVRIQSLPDGAKVGIKALAAHFPESEYRIAAALKELEAAGYLSRSRHRTAGQRIVTRTTYYERPGTNVNAPVRRVSLVKRPRPRPVDLLLHRPAVDLLSGLRLRDPRLTLSVRDIAALAPDVSSWLASDVPASQVTHMLTSRLPDGPIHRPVRLLTYRLHEAPPPVPAPAPQVARVTVAPMQNCDGCDRGFRSHEPGHCGDCAAGGPGAVA
ncbi:helix-turn-helix domain-containing protein [Streptomyces sp. 21So2-11]|uniref:helix-turn-helix domain-containing protein n=1 Tax=Streptomyces sp. 21So2-11 TaxID=3144408 RepID=UPI00321B1D7C